MGMLGSRQLVLETSPRLRILTLLLFYFTQGFPTGLFTIAVPAWMAARGADTIATATVVGVSTLPWSLKLLNGFLIDRYAYLPMGRRRSWIIGAQAFVVFAFLAGALLAPDHRDVALLAAIGFCANLGIAFQDVGIDSLAVDIMPENERSQAAGIMFGAQMLGIAAATAFGGLLLDDWGFSVCLVIAAMVPAAVMTFGIVIRERIGEKRLPWTAGVSHPHNLSLQATAWLPLLLPLPLLAAASRPWTTMSTLPPARRCSLPRCMRSAPTCRRGRCWRQRCCCRRSAGCCCRRRSLRQLSSWRQWRRRWRAR